MYFRLWIVIIHNLEVGSTDFEKANLYSYLFKNQHYNNSNIFPMNI